MVPTNEEVSAVRSGVLPWDSAAFKLLANLVHYAHLGGRAVLHDTPVPARLLAAALGHPHPELLSGDLEVRVLDGGGERPIVVLPPPEDERSIDAWPTLRRLVQELDQEETTSGLESLCGDSSAIVVRSTVVNRAIVLHASSQPTLQAPGDETAAQRGPALMCFLSIRICGSHPITSGGGGGGGNGGFCGCINTVAIGGNSGGQVKTPETSFTCYTGLNSLGQVSDPCCPVIIDGPAAPPPDDGSTKPPRGLSGVSARTMESHAGGWFWQRR